MAFRAASRGSNNEDEDAPLLENGDLLPQAFATRSPDLATAELPADADVPIVGEDPPKDVYVPTKERERDWWFERSRTLSQLTPLVGLKLFPTQLQHCVHRVLPAGPRRGKH